MYSFGTERNELEDEEEHSYLLFFLCSQTPLIKIRKKFKTGNVPQDHKFQYDLIYMVRFLLPNEIEQHKDRLNQCFLSRIVVFSLTYTSLLAKIFSMIKSTEKV